MNLQPLNDKLLVRVHGLLNTGAICYFSSFLQSLLSCTSVTEFFLTNSARLTNPVAQEYINLINIMRNDNTGAVINASTLNRVFIEQVNLKYPEKKFGSQQEDAGEGMHLFLDIINEPQLYKLFTHRSIATIWCNYCKKEIGKQQDESCVFEIPCTIPSNTNINNYVIQNGCKIPDYLCTKCKLKQCIRIYQLSMVPENLVIMFNKFKSKTIISFPDHLTFESKNGPIRYMMVSKIEHIGSKSGHYMSHCLRKGNLLYLCNDSNVSQGSNEPNSNTYILFYHIIKSQ